MITPAPIAIATSGRILCDRFKIRAALDAKARFAIGATADLHASSPSLAGVDIPIHQPGRAHHRSRADFRRVRGSSWRRREHEYRSVRRDGAHLTDSKQIRTPV